MELKEHLGVREVGIGLPERRTERASLRRAGVVAAALALLASALVTAVGASPARAGGPL